MPSLCISFGDTVCLKDSRIGTVRFIGRTTVKKIVFYGIHLKQNNGNHDGSMHNRRYFKCPPNHGIFVKKSHIKEITKKHTISASFHYNQYVMVNNIGIGIVKYIGMTHFGNAYWHGIETENTLHNIDLSNNSNMYALTDSEINKFHYFDSDEHKSIFARGNQIKSARNREFRRREVYFKRKPIKIKIECKMDEKEEKNDPYNDYINKTLISMMDSLNIPISKRSKILSMDNTNKLLLIQQWFITPNTHQLQKTMNKNIRQRKKSQSLILLKKNNKNDKELENKSKTKIVTIAPTLPMSPTQSSSKNLNFDGCNVSKFKRIKKPKTCMKTKRKKSKSLILLNNSKNKKHIALYEKQLKIIQSESKAKRSKKLKKPSKTSVKIRRKKSHSLELKHVKSNPINNKNQKSFMSYLKPKNVKDKKKKKSKSTSLLIKKSELENVKKNKSIKPKSMKRKSKKNIKKSADKKRRRKESKSAVLLIKKSEKYKLKSKKDIQKYEWNWKNSKNKNRKTNKRKRKELSDRGNKKSKLKSKTSGSATLLTTKVRGRNTKKGASSSVKMKSKSKSNKLKSKKKKRKNRHIVDKWID